MPSFATPAAWTASTVRAEAQPVTCEPTSVADAGMGKRPIEHYAMTWRGIEVLVAYQPESFGLAECLHSHLEVMTSEPRRPLPMTETGYKSLFLPAGTIEELGGPLAYVSRWLEHAAKSPQWKSIEQDSRQANLF
ncbi:MAG: hypothetical protein ACK4TP_12800 [Hyphomicrobium sp.]